MTGPGGAGPASAAWQAGSDATAATLVLAGDWRGHAATALRRLSPAASDIQRLAFDTSALNAWDGDLAPALWPVLLPLQRRGVVPDLTGLPPELRAALALALAANPELPRRLAAAPGGWQRLRRLLSAAVHELLNSVAFFGEVLLALARVLRRPLIGNTGALPPRVIRGGELLRQIDRCGPLSLPIVTLISALIGLMLAYMGGAQLERVGSQSFIADVVTVGVVRELAGLMTGVILAGRIGAAYAAELATMQTNEEIDALRTLGIDPVEHLVLPRVLAMLLVAPLLIAYAALVGTVAGAPAAIAIYGVPLHEYLHKCVAALTWTHLWIGLAKGTLYMLLVALAGCREGLHAARNAQAVGEATTRAVVKSLVWIVIAASATTVLFQSLGL
jgi:phospholipid/cholesterol/gamma-HCH transport system permease protein